MTQKMNITGSPHMGPQQVKSIISLCVVDLLFRAIFVKRK